MGVWGFTNIPELSCETKHSAVIWTVLKEGDITEKKKCWALCGLAAPDSFQSSSGICIFHLILLMLLIVSGSFATISMLLKQLWVFSRQLSVTTLRFLNLSKDALTLRKQALPLCLCSFNRITEKNVVKNYINSDSNKLQIAKVV